MSTSFKLLFADGTSNDFTLRAGSRITIGRCPQCDVSVQNRAISWKHCQISVGDGRLFIEDISQHGVAVEQRGQTVELEKHLPTGLSLDAVIVMPCRGAAKHAREVIHLQALVPTASEPTEEPPPPPPEDTALATTLQTIAQDISGLRAGVEGNFTHLHNRLTSQGEAITAQQNELSQFREELESLKRQVSTQQSPIYLFLANITVYHCSPVRWQEKQGNHRMFITSGSSRTYQGWPVVDRSDSRERAVAGQVDAEQIWTGHLLPLEDDRSRPY